MDGRDTTVHLSAPTSPFDIRSLACPIRTINKRRGVLCSIRTCTVYGCGIRACDVVHHTHRGGWTYMARPEHRSNHSNQRETILSVTIWTRDRWVPLVGGAFQIPTGAFSYKKQHRVGGRAGWRWSTSTCFSHVLSRSSFWVGASGSYTLTTGSRKSIERVLDICYALSQCELT